MNKEKLIEELVELKKSLKPTLVRRKEQLKGIVKLLECDLVLVYQDDNLRLFNKIKEWYK